MKEKFEYSQKAYTTNRLPLFLRAAMVRNSELKGDMQQLADNGVETIVIQRNRRTHPFIREILYDNGPEKLISQALEPPREGDSSNVTLIRTAVDTGLHVFAPEASDMGLKYQEVMDRIDSGLKEQKVKYAMRRFMYDFSKKEKFKMFTLGLISTTTAGIVTGLELIGLKGLGMLIAQSVDDIGNTVTSATINRNEKKSIFKQMKDYWPVLPVIAGAAVADNTIIPQLLESPNTWTKAAGGLLFSIGAVGGSAVANTINLVKRKRYNNEHNEHKELMDTKQHPFNSSLWFGIALSAIASEYAAAKGILLGQPYSGVLQTFLGELESMIAFGGIFLGNGVSRIVDHTKDWITVKKAEKEE